MATNEDLMHAIQTMDSRVLAMDGKLDSHVAKEEPVLQAAQTLIDEHGTKEDVKARINFINAWMERERDRAELRKAVIKHGTLLAMTAIVIFIFRAVWSDIVDLVWAVKK